MGRMPGAPVAEGSHSYRGVGLYTVPEAAHLLRVQTRKLRRWTSGYTFADGRSSKPVFSRDYPRLRSPQTLSFQDLLELLLVSRFRGVGWSLQRIRQEGHAAEKRFKVTHPFASKRVLTDGKYWYTELPPLLGEDRSPYRIIQPEPSRRLVFSDIIARFLVDLDYEGEEVSSFYPEGRVYPVVIDRSRAFGKPIETESGVPTRVLYDSHMAGDSIEEVARWYHVSPETVRAAVAYEKKLLQA
jgi:uncharacterized protein (DUF433 family)